jgi:hypothetical protein
MTRTPIRSQALAWTGIAVAITLVTAGCSDDDDKTSAPPTRPTFSIPTFSPPSISIPTSLPDTDTPTRPTTTRVTTTTASRSPSPTAKKSDFDSGSCLAGKIEETGREQDELTEVSCSDPSATFKILRTFPYSFGGRPCDNVSGSDYSYDEYMTRNGVPTGVGTTYCLQEL